VVVPIVTVLGLAAPAHAESREVTGQAGVLGEWELTANVTERIAGRARELVGPLNLKHVGICTVDGPEQKNGELRLRISESSTRVTGTLLIEGTECSYSADIKNLQDGIMSCPDRRNVPLVLSIP
jgi:hypothetical protein